MRSDCLICGAKESSVLYHGSIRIGKYGQQSPEDKTVYKCAGCGVGYLAIEDRESLCYETDEYRRSVDSTTISDYYRLHDSEQINNLSILDLHFYREKTIVDVGCGGGAFLDFLVGYANTTIAVEPYVNYHEVLSAKHRVYNYVDDALKDYKSQADIVVSFAVIEHVDDPLGFLKKIRSLVAPGGKVLISTPNTDDWLVDFSPADYASFFFRKAHYWYFNAYSLEKIAVLAGYASVKFHFKQRFDVSNALVWLKDGRPSGLGAYPLLEELDSHFKQLLESKGKSDYIYAELLVE